MIDGSFSSRPAFVLKVHIIDTREKSGFVNIIDTREKSGFVMFEYNNWFGGYIILIFSATLV